MNLDTLISSNAVIFNPEIKSKKRALELLADSLAQEATLSQQDTPESDDADDEIDEQEIFQLLTEREKLGSTSLGHGVALPHARTSMTDHAIGAFLKIDDGIDFDSPDNQATDLIFALMVPEHYTDEHLKILAYLATLFSDENFCDSLRSAQNSNETYQKLVNTTDATQAS